MATEEQKAENIRMFKARHTERKYTRATLQEIEKFMCRDCNTRPYISLTDYHEKTSLRCVMLACECFSKYRWFEIVYGGGDK